MTLGRAIPFAPVLQKIPSGCYLTQRRDGPAWSWGHRLGGMGGAAPCAGDRCLRSRVLGRRMGRAE